MLRRVLSRAPRHIRMGGRILYTKPRCHATHSRWFSAVVDDEYLQDPVSSSDDSGGPTHCNAIFPFIPSSADAAHPSLANLRQLTEQGLAPPGQVTKAGNECIYQLMQEAMPDRRLLEEDLDEVFARHEDEYNKQWFHVAQEVLLWMEASGHANSVSYMNMIVGFFNDSNPPTGHQYLGMEWSPEDMKYFWALFEKVRERGMVMDLLSYRHLLTVAYHCGKNGQAGGDNMALCHSVIEEMQLHGLQVPLDTWFDLQLYYLSNDQFSQAVDTLESMAQNGTQPPSLSMCHWLIDAFDFRRYSKESLEEQEELEKLVDRVFDVMNTYGNVIVKDIDTDDEYVSEDFDSDYDDLRVNRGDRDELGSDYSSGDESYSEVSEEEEEEEEETNSQFSWEHVHLPLRTFSEPYDSYCHRLTEFRFKSNKLEIKYDVEPLPKGRSRLAWFNKLKTTKDQCKQGHDLENENGNEKERGPEERDNVSSKAQKGGAKMSTGKRGKRKD